MASFYGEYKFQISQREADRTYEREEEIMNRNGKLDANPINRIKTVSAIFKLFFLLVIDDPSLNS